MSLLPREVLLIVAIVVPDGGEGGGQFVVLGRGHVLLVVGRLGEDRRLHRPVWHARPGRAGGAVGALPDLGTGVVASLCEARGTKTYTLGGSVGFC